ncbi:MAG TPA: thermonuclease family protein [Bauldia sp.]|nr:thermonuclease family protein [Bauldia sp.]
MAAALLVLAGAAPLAAQEPAPDIVPPPSRDVTPPGFTPAPAGSGPLVREPVAPPPPIAERWHKFILPMTTDAATFVVADRQIDVAGVVADPRQTTCRLADGTEWPCGEAALAALRRFLLGRPVECWFRSDDPARPLTVPCRVGKTDIGLWLLATGWAKPADGAPEEYRKASQTARCARLGLWRGETPPADCPAKPPA